MFFPLTEDPEQAGRGLKYRLDLFSLFSKLKYLDNKNLHLEISTQEKAKQLEVRAMPRFKEYKQTDLWTPYLAIQYICIQIESVESVLSHAFTTI